MTITYAGDPFVEYRNYCGRLLIFYKHLRHSKSLPQAMLEMTETGGTETFLYWCQWFQERAQISELRFFCRFVLFNQKTIAL
jgi:hypothetical protein